MNKRKITDRLQLLNDGRTHYLEFLRNLTPQIILFSVILLLGMKLDFTRFDFNNMLSTALFFSLLGAFALAFYANATLFYERCFADLLKWSSDLSASLCAQGIKGHRLFLEKFRAIWKARLIEVLELMVFFWFFQIALAIVMIMSLHSASSIMQSAHHAG